MTLNTIVKSCKRKSHRGSQSITTDLITTDIIACINETAREVQRLVPKRFWHKYGSVSLALGTVGTAAVYSLPSDCQELGAIYFTKDGSLVSPVKVNSDREWLGQVWNPTGALNTPRFYREIGAAATTFYKQIEVYPIPDATYTATVEYYKTKGADFTNDDLSTEITNIPDYLQDVLEKGAVYKFLKQFDDAAQLVAKADYEQAKLDFEIADEQDQDTLLAFRWGVSAPTTPGFRLP